MTQIEYEEVRSNLRFIMLFLTRYINRLELLGGIEIPKKDFIFDSKVVFEDDSMMLLIDPYIVNEQIILNLLKGVITLPDIPSYIFPI